MSKFILTIDQFQSANLFEILDICMDGLQKNFILAKFEAQRNDVILIFIFFRFIEVFINSIIQVLVLILALDI